MSDVVQTHICADCGFTKQTTEADFAEHVFFHNDLDEILVEFGVIQEERLYSIEVSRPDDRGCDLV